MCDLWLRVLCCVTNWQNAFENKKWWWSVQTDTRPYRFTCIAISICSSNWFCVSRVGMAWHDNIANIPYGVLMNVSWNSTNQKSVGRYVSVRKLTLVENFHARIHNTWAWILVFYFQPFSFLCEHYFYRYSICVFVGRMYTYTREYRTKVANSRSVLCVYIEDQ